MAQQAAEIVQPQQIAAACVEVNAMREAEESLAASIKLSESDDGAAELDAAEGLCDEVEAVALALRTRRSRCTSAPCACAGSASRRVFERHLLLFYTLVGVIGSSTKHVSDVLYV